jgi:hypothetical protein
MPSHRDLYPAQYADPLCGLRVRVANSSDDSGKPVEGIVERVVPSRFGPLAILAEYGAARAWPAADCKPVECYTLDGVEVGLAEFLDANPDLDPEEERAVRALQPGEEMYFGGGAAAVFVLRRELPGWSRGVENA